MSLRACETWQPQANQWNGVTPDERDFEEYFDFTETPPLAPEAEVAMGAMETVLFWPKATVEDPYFPMGTPGADLLG